MEVKSLVVPCIERLSDALGAMRIEVVLNHMHLLARVRSRHALHEGDQVILGAPFATISQAPARYVHPAQQSAPGCRGEYIRTPDDAAVPASAHARMLTVDGLNASFLVDAQYHRVARDLAVGLCSHCLTRCGRTSPACQMRCR